MNNNMNNGQNINFGNEKTDKIILLIVMGFILFCVFLTIPMILSNFFDAVASNIDAGEVFDDGSFKILSTYENKDLEEEIVEYGRKNGISISFKYSEDLESVATLNSTNNYDAVWASNSIWLYQVTGSTITNSKSISVNPVVLAVKKSKAQEFGLTSGNVKNSDILNVIKEKKLKYVMSSVVKTNSGATAYLSFLNSLAGSPEILTEDMLDDSTLKSNMIDLFSGVERVSGTDSFLEDMFVNSDDYEAVIAAETSLIRINKKLVEDGKEPLYLIYPVDGVAINDSPFAYVSRGQDENVKEQFEKIQSYLLSKSEQKKLEKTGRRTWYGGIKANTSKTEFNPNWGIDTTKYLVPFNYPSKSVINKATALYLDEFRKPSHTVFLLDYSGSMSGEGEEQLTAAMENILDYANASKDLIQFSDKDKITIIPFSSMPKTPFSRSDFSSDQQMISKIKSLYTSGGTNIYDSSIDGLKILKDESSEYNKTIILMTDGQSNSGSQSSLEYYYRSNYLNIPIYSIMFGNASSEQLSDIATLTNAKVFDGRSDLLSAFKEVRSYN